MGRRDFQSTVADSLPRILQEQAKNGVGSIKFSKKDKKSIGKLYLRGGSIYAIELSTYNPNIVNRIATNEYISETNREQLLNKFQDDIANLACINYVLTYQLFPEKPLMTYIKDYFLDAFDILYAWEDVNVEWRTNDEPPLTTPTVPNANPLELIEKLNKRKAFIVEEICSSWDTKEEDIGTLVFRRNFDDYNDPDYITSVILSLAEGQWSISGVTEYLGLSNFNTKILIYELWKTGLIDIIVPSGIVITNRTAEKTQNIPAVQAQQSTELVEKTSVYVSLFTEPKKQDSTEPVESIEEIDSIDSTVVHDAFAESFYVKPVAVEPVAVEPVVVEPVVVEPVVAPINISPSTMDQTLTKENKMPESIPFTGSSRLRAIAEQLKAELRELASNIEKIRLTKTSKEEQITSLTSERLTLVEKLKSIDVTIHERNRELHTIDTELMQLETDYHDSIKLTQDLR